jgi:lipopolysaccharide biosynthesis glycosyltransferase
MTNKMCVVIACDESYIPHAATMLCSLLENNTDPINIFLLHDGIKDKQLHRLGDFVNKYNSELLAFEIHDASLASLKINDYFKTINYYRLMIPEILPPEIGKALYLDCDTIIRGSINPLWNIEFGDKLFAAVTTADDIETKKAYIQRLGLPKDADYFNSGVLLIDVGKWRRQAVHKKVIDYIKNNPDKIYFVDQDGLNAVLYDDWIKLPLIWNVQSPFFLEPEFRIRYADLLAEPIIVHFTSERIKPWNDRECQYPYSSEYVKYREKTPWHSKKFENLLNRTYTQIAIEPARKILPWFGKIDILWKVNRNFLRIAEIINSAKENKALPQVAQDSVNDINSIRALFPDQMVISGPFKGMKYPLNRGIGSTITPKLLGTYEIELREIIEEICHKGYSTIINIGCADGYYAIGIAKRIRNVKVFAYDKDPKAREMCQSAAKANNVSKRVQIEDIFTMRTIPKIFPNEQGLIICDCGGDEEYIFYNDGENWLHLINQFDLLIEIHEIYRRGISGYIYNLFSASHNIQIIHSVNDSLRPRIYNCPLSDEIDPDKKEKLMSEHRLGIICWFYMKRKKPCTDKTFLPISE